LILDRIRIKPEHRGRTYGSYAAALTIQSFRPLGGLAKVDPIVKTIFQLE
jgi:hypothetical protein